MPAVKSDYYELLGIPRDADEETIRRAFHAAARETNPDASASPDAERRFRELAEAYSTLSKPSSRLLYDRYGYRGRGNRGFDEALWEAREQSVRGDSVRIDVDLRGFEAREGTRKLVEFDTSVVCRACEGRGTTTADCSGDTCPECAGSGRVVERRRLRLRIPPGIDDRTQLRVGGEGHAATNGGVPGDLLVDVHVAPEPRDPRLVRYLALALFLGAVAALLVYLFL